MMECIKRVIVSVLTVGASACISGGGTPHINVGAQPPSAASALQALIGEWTLVRLEAQGLRRASGRLTFDQFNNIVVRAELAPGEAGAAPPRVVLVDFAAKATPASANELSFLGLETRSAPDALLEPGSDQSAWRHFAVSGDTLTLWQEDGRGQRIGSMTFQRAR